MREPTVDELELAAEQFMQWVREHVPNSTVFVSGGFSVMKLGGPRITLDVDVAMDLSKTSRPGSGRPYDVNSLKSMAATDEQFVVGPKIYWRLPTINVQVDFVDANLFWTPPAIFSSVIVLPKTRILSLDAPTLLVGKMMSGPERSQSDAELRTQKQMNDITDAFLLDHCSTEQIILQEPHILHLKTPVNVAEFIRLCGSFEEVDAQGFIEGWNTLCTTSGISDEWHASEL